MRTDMREFSECTLRKCNRCFVGIFYDDVFARIIFILLIHLFYNTFKYLDFLFEAQRISFGSAAEIINCPCK